MASWLSYGGSDGPSLSQPLGDRHARPAASGSLEAGAAAGPGPAAAQQQPDRTFVARREAGGRQLFILATWHCAEALLPPQPPDGAAAAAAGPSGRPAAAAAAAAAAFAAGAPRRPPATWVEVLVTDGAGGAWRGEAHHTGSQITRPEDWDASTRAALASPDAGPVPSLREGGSGGGLYGASSFGGGSSASSGSARLEWEFEVKESAYNIVIFCPLTREATPEAVAAASRQQLEHAAAEGLALKRSVGLARTAASTLASELAEAQRQLGRDREWKANLEAELLCKFRALLDSHRAAAADAAAKLAAAEGRVEDLERQLRDAEHSEHASDADHAEAMMDDAGWEGAEGGGEGGMDGGEGEQGGRGGGGGGAGSSRGPAQRSGRGAARPAASAETEPLPATQTLSTADWAGLMAAHADAGGPPPPPPPATAAGTAVKREGAAMAVKREAGEDDQEEADMSALLGGVAEPAPAARRRRGGGARGGGAGGFGSMFEKLTQPQ